VALETFRKSMARRSCRQNVNISTKETAFLVLVFTFCRQLLLAMLFLNVSSATIEVDAVQNRQLDWSLHADWKRCHNSLHDVAGYLLAFHWNLAMTTTRDVREFFTTFTLQK
jgi:hypothetical protein